MGGLHVVTELFNVNSCGWSKMSNIVILGCTLKPVFYPLKFYFENFLT